MKRLLGGGEFLVRNGPAQLGQRAYESDMSTFRVESATPDLEVLP
jgi:hypothetical protein